MTYATKSPWQVRDFRCQQNTISCTDSVVRRNNDRWLIAPLYNSKILYILSRWNNLLDHKMLWPCNTDSLPLKVDLNIRLVLRCSIKGLQS